MDEPNKEAMGREEALRWLDERAAAAYIVDELSSAEHATTAVAQAILDTLTLTVMDPDRATRLHAALLRQATRAQDGRDIDAASREDVGAFLKQWEDFETNPEDLAEVAQHTKKATESALEATRRLKELAEKLSEQGMGFQHGDHFHPIDAPGDSRLVN